jgi:hypothetical protein
MATTVRFYCDPLREMARWAARHYKLGEVSILFSDNIPGKRKGYVHRSGATYYWRGGITVELNVHRRISYLVQVLAHELTHVVVMKRHGPSGHGPKFVKTANELISRWNSFAATRRGPA